MASGNQGLTFTVLSLVIPTLSPSTIATQQHLLCAEKVETLQNAMSALGVSGETEGH